MVRTPATVTAIIVALTAMTLSACDGLLLDGAAGPAGARRTPGGPVACGSDSIVLGTAPMRRLSNAEYLHTLRDLFPGVTPSLPELPEDTEVSGFENDARSLGPSDVRVARWEEIAFRYGREVTSSPARLAAFLPCASGASDAGAQRACGERLVRDFGRRAYRRPLSDDEVGRFVAFFERQREAVDFEGAVHLTTIALLQSPWFLYRIELPGEGARDGVVPLDPYQLATRLSYFLWESTPDDALLDAAGAGALATPAQLEAQARRMLEDPRAREAVVDFHRQWLDFDRIGLDEHQGRVTELYPSWNETLRASIDAEQGRFVEGVVFDGEGTLGALLTSRTAWVNGPLAALYGVNGPTDASTWQEVTLPAGERSGLLTRAGFLASHAHSGNGSPPLRGVFVMERLLCEPRPSPPADANVTPPTATPGEARTNRQLFEERTAPPVCNTCHVRIDGFGFGFEHYDAIGAYRELDDGLPVDASGNLTGTDVDGPFVGGVELSEALAESARVQACATRMWFRYALGRAPERQDQCVVDRLSRRFGESGGDVRDLMVGIVTSPEFRNRPLASE